MEMIVVFWLIILGWVVSVVSGINLVITDRKNMPEMLLAVVYAIFGLTLIIYGTLGILP